MVRKFVHVDRKNREFLCKAFGVSEMTVYRALHYADKNSAQSKQARKIRSFALLNGGIAKVVAPEVETFHDADGYMRQYLPNGVMLEFNKENGSVRVINKKGETVKRESDVKIKDIPELQTWASAL